MRYEKPILKKNIGKKPPITTNFAPPPSEEPLFERSESKKKCSTDLTIKAETSK